MEGVCAPVPWHRGGAVNVRIVPGVCAFGHDVLGTAGEGRPPEGAAVGQREAQLCEADVYSPEQVGVSRDVVPV